MGNAADFKKALTGLEARVRGRVASRAVEAGARTIAAEIRANAPVLSGKTRASVEVDPAVAHGNSVKARVTVSGGHQDDPGSDRSGGNIIGFIEYGRRGQAPDPFVRRSVAAKKDQVAGQVAEDIADGIG